jgi:Protein of unknown function (DUF664)
VSERIPVYLEVGAKRTFAGAIDWPGWSRAGRREDDAIEALIAYADRYRRVVGRLRLGFEAPADATTLDVVERLKGDAGTEFGVPGGAPRADAKPIEPADAKRLQAILRGCWRTLEAAVEGAGDRELRKGPRGGGRTVEGIVDHVLGAESGYMSRLGRRFTEPGAESPGARVTVASALLLDELAVAIRDGVPPAGPRGGSRWTARYYVRRSAWHVLDHAWEIEDRTVID